MENILSSTSYWEPFFYRTASGTEIDLVLEKSKQRIAVEFKVSTTPSVTPGFWSALEDLQCTEAWIISPVEAPYPIKKNVMVAPLETLIQRLH